MQHVRDGSKAVPDWFQHARDGSKAVPYCTRDSFVSFDFLAASFLWDDACPNLATLQLGEHAPFIFCNYCAS